MRHHEHPARPGWRSRLHEIVFEADTTAGKLFDVLLLTAIVSSVAAVMLESVPSVRVGHGAALLRIEWGFTLLSPSSTSSGWRACGIRRATP